MLLMSGPINRLPSPHMPSPSFFIPFRGTPADPIRDEILANNVYKTKIHIILRLAINII